MLLLGVSCFRAGTTSKGTLGLISPHDDDDDELELEKNDGVEVDVDEFLCVVLVVPFSRVNVVDEGQDDGA